MWCRALLLSAPDRAALSSLPCACRKGGRGSHSPDVQLQLPLHQEQPQLRVPAWGEGGVLGRGLGSLPESCPTLPCGILFSKGEALVGADLGEGWGELGVTCLSLIALMHTEY